MRKLCVAGFVALTRQIQFFDCDPGRRSRTSLPRAGIRFPFRGKRDGLEILAKRLFDLEIKNPEDLPRLISEIGNWSCKVTFEHPLHVVARKLGSDRPITVFPSDGRQLRKTTSNPTSAARESDVNLPTKQAETIR
jgi:hypothetical protein